MDRAGITSMLVERLVATQFPAWSGLPVTPVEHPGWDNVTFRLGDELSVRLPSAARYASQVEKEQRWLPRLAPYLPLPIPDPVERGVPGCGFPYSWSVYRWLEGAQARLDLVADHEAFACDVAAFLVALRSIGAADGPTAGPHSFSRGGPLSTYDGETRQAIAALRHRVDARSATAVWDEALASTWGHTPVWVHGDVAASNLLVAHGRLAAVIDFGSSAVGDPSCDVVIAWTLFGGASRRAFRERLALDSDTWARGRGWALWKALITLAHTDDDEDAARAARRFGWRAPAADVIEEVLAGG